MLIVGRISNQGKEVLREFQGKENISPANKNKKRQEKILAIKGIKCLSSLVTLDRKTIIFVPQMEIDVRQITARGANGFWESKE